jgi:invasion protein IalB
MENTGRKGNRTGRQDKGEEMAVRNLTALGAAVCIGTMAATALPATAQDASPTPSRSSESFGDWSVDCTLAVTPAQDDGPQDAPRRVCEAVQVYSSTNNRAEIARLAFGRNADDGTIVVAMRFIADVSFGSAPELADGTSALLAGRITRCTGGFCFAQFEGGEDVAQLLLGAENPAIRYPVSSGQVLAIGVSTDGLTEALETLEARSQ